MYYANICLDFDNNVYTVKDKNYTNAVIKYPVVCNFRRYSESESDSDIDDRAELPNAIMIIFIMVLENMIKNY